MERKPLTLDPNGKAHQTLRQVVEHMREFPDHYNMHMWIDEVLTRLSDSPYLGCGTVACIGGTADAILHASDEDEYIGDLLDDETGGPELSKQLFYGHSYRIANDYSWWQDQACAFGWDSNDNISLFSFMNDNTLWVANTLEAWLDGKTDPILG